jgi:6-phosphogluconolactonase
MPLRPNERLLIGKDIEETARLAADALISALRDPGRPKSVALSGGSGPPPLFSVLSKPPHRDRLPWHEVQWVWGDERAVAPDSPDSNYHLAAEKLLGPLNIPADRIHRMPADRPDLDNAAAEYEQTIRRILPAGPNGVPVLGVALQGVGADGHTASLFPGTAALDESQRLVVPNYSPHHEYKRLTMTYPMLMAAREILFLVTSAKKAGIMAGILADPPADVPAARLRDAPGQITWVLDAQAARLVCASASQ